VTVDTMARIDRERPVMIDRKYLQRIVHVTANVAPTATWARPARRFRAWSMSRRCPRASPPRWAARPWNSKRPSASGVCRPHGAGLVYMVLASQFKSLIDPLVIMFSVPLGVSGVSSCCT